MLGATQEVLTLERIARVWQVEGEMHVALDGTPQFIAHAGGMEASVFETI